MVMITADDYEIISADPKSCLTMPPSMFPGSLDVCI
jgi:hypothetical protein